MTTLNKRAWSSEAIAVAKWIDRLADLMGQYDGDPDGGFDAIFHSHLHKLDQMSHRCGNERSRLLAYCLDCTSGELNQSLIHRQSREQPFGYAGDYQIIDWTYTQFAGSAGRGRIWDEFYHRQHAPIAVCNRKDHFGWQLRELAEALSHRPLRVLNVASGPGRELIDGAKFANLHPDELEVLCVEIDACAVAYARHLLGDDWRDSVQFHQGNALRFQPPKEYDLVWSAGLFDYLDDRASVLLLRRLWNAVAAGGRLVVGNFSTSHRTRPWIEWCGNWHLFHRSESNMEKLAASAGIPLEYVTQAEDSWQVIRFLYAQGPR